MKRELLAFLMVGELPNDSSKILALIICCAKTMEFDPQKYFKNIFDVSVFPDPDSPEIMMDWGIFTIFIFRLIPSAWENIDNEIKIKIGSTNYGWLIQTITYSKNMCWQYIKQTTLILFDGIQSVQSIHRFAWVYSN